ncbi:MAG TPA: indolepyruvate ferredoxin oxidoreductase subunit alpha, partial [Thermoanaerobacterales bacterium]|nr:indolepyruvate ferredoxin oxidoreductase subunit alpha [Thermoanaerobacterales bacterium]
NCFGNDLFPPYGEMTPDTIRNSVYGKTLETIEVDEDKIIARAPAMCAGCPHRGFFYQLGKKRNLVISGDIGCYTLGFNEPYNAMDFNICMGASASAGHGVQKVFDLEEDSNKRVVAVMGDSTFFHSGINSLMNIAYNGSNVITAILDNRITGMTGHQENPGTGYTLSGDTTVELNIEKLVEACGINHIKVINPNNINEVDEALNWALKHDEPSVIITRWPCVLKKLTHRDRDEFNNVFEDKYEVKHENCTGCKVCIRLGCPAISFDTKTRKAKINIDECVGCAVCSQVCLFNAIGKVE